MSCHASQMDARNDNLESGRSLIEMLGVLAVMGVLTIGAMAGFNYAMNKQRANATVNYVNQLAIEGSRQMLAGSNHLSLLDYPDKTPSGYGVELGLLSDTNAYFEVYVKDVPEAVCSQIQTMAEGWRGLDTLWINEDGKDCNKETNTISFIFTDSLSRGTSGTRCSSDEGCTGCQTCQRGFCTDTDSACPGDTPNCVSGQCQKCKAGEYDDPLWSCSTCERVFLKGMTKEQCLKCPNHYFSRNYYQGNPDYCIYCAGTVSADGEHCLQESCPNPNMVSGIFKVPNVTDKCLSCDSLGQSEWMGSDQLMEKEVDLDLIYARARECQKCPGRRFILNYYNSGKCAKTCPAGQFFDHHGNCKTCGETFLIGWGVFSQDGDRPRPYNITDEALVSCLSCDNMFVAGRQYNSRGQLAGFLQCVPCQSSAAWQAQATDCARCAGQRYMDGDLCTLCPADTSGLTAEQQAECGGASP